MQHDVLQDFDAAVAAAIREHLLRLARLLHERGATPEEIEDELRQRTQGTGAGVAEARSRFVDWITSRRVDPPAEERP